MFTNVNQIKIDLHKSAYKYKFDLYSLLSVIQDSKRDIKYHIQASRGLGDEDDPMDAWLSSFLSTEVVSAYKEKQSHIEYQKTQFLRTYDNIFISFVNK